MTSSADGTKYVGGINGGPLYTSEATSIAGTSVGVGGSVSGGQFDAVDLQCIDSVSFMVRSYAGYLAVK